MRKLVVGSFISLDGVVQAPGGADEDTDGGFKYGGWVGPLFTDDLGEYITGLITSADALLFGRRTYVVSEMAWPPQGDSDPVAAKFNSAPKYVASNTLTTTNWDNVTILSGDVVGEIARLKEQEGGDIQVTGSGNLVQTLLKHDLVDEIALMIFPVVIGSGKRLFGDGTLPQNLKLVDSKVMESGVIVATYVRNGELATANVGAEYEQ